jgi:AcrR family transcriptional regulator
VSRADSPPTKPKAAAAASELGDRRRLDLLEAAYELTAEKGLAGLRTRDVAARAKVNISTLHYYFGTKEALILALVEHTCGKFNTGNRWPGGPSEDPLQAHFANTWRVFQETPNLAVVLEELGARGRRDPETRAAFRSVHERWNGGLQLLFKALAASGRLRPDVDPALGAFIVSSFVIGASVQLGVNGSAFDFAAVARELVRWVSVTPNQNART